MMKGFGRGILWGAALGAVAMVAVTLRARRGRFVAVRVRRGPPRLAMRRGRVEASFPRLRP